MSPWRHQRSPLLATAAALVLTLASAGCGTAAPEIDPPADERRTTIDDAYGEVTITGTPERVLAAGNNEADLAVALGVTPVAMAEWADAPDGIPPWRADLLDGTAPPLIKYNPDGYDVVETLGYEPDLVLADPQAMDQGPYDQLSEQVPVLALEAWELAPDEAARLIGQALDREDEAEQLISETEALLDETRAANAAIEGTTVSFLGSWEPGTVTTATEDLRSEWNVLNRVGFAPAEGDADLEPYAAVGPEQYSAFDGDVLIAWYGSADIQAEVEDSPLFQRIPAVQAGRYLAFTDGLNAELVRAANLSSIQYAARELVPEVVSLAENE